MNRKNVIVFVSRFLILAAFIAQLTGPTVLPAISTSPYLPLDDPIVSSIASNFNGTAIAAGNTIWFNSIVKVSGVSADPVQLQFVGQTIQFSAGGTDYNLPLPDTLITFSPGATQATTTFDQQTNRWETSVPIAYTGNVFLGGTAWQVPGGGLSGGVNPVTWSGRFVSDSAGISVNWKWAAAVYTQFAPNSDDLGVKPIDGSQLNPYPNSDHAGTPENFKDFVIGGARGGGGSNYTGSYSGTGSATPPTQTPTPTPTETSTPTPTPTFPSGVTCYSWQDGSLQGWAQSPWTSPEVQTVTDGNGLYGSATSSGNFQAGIWFQLPGGGPYKVLFYGQQLSKISVAQGDGVPTSSGPLTPALAAGPDGSYQVTAAYLEVQWSFDAPVDLNTATVLQAFCLAPFAPTPTFTPSASATPSATPTVTETPLATSTPMPTATALPTNYAIQFNPSSVPQGILFPAASSLNFGLDMTIEFWLRTTSTYGGTKWYDSQWILDKDIGGEGHADWAVTLRFGKIVFDNGTGVCCSDQPLYGTQPVNDGAWHHVAIVRNVSSGNGLTQIYIDGAVDTSGTFSTNSLSNTLALVLGAENGTSTSGLAHALHGDIDDLRLWNIPRSQSEILQDMFALSAGDEPALLGYWRFNEGSGQIAYDQTQYHVDGQLGSSPSPDASDPTWILNSELYSGTPTATPVVPTPTGPTPTATVTSTPTNSPTPTLTPTPTLPPDSALVIPGWIGSPANQSAVSGVVPITLADGVTLVNGTIAYWPTNDRSAVNYLATDLSGTGGDTLATLDTTTLANGSYILMLSGTDSNGTQQNSGVLITAAGNYKPGRVRFTITDFSVPLVGLPIAIGRTYDSLERNQVGDFGHGWSLAIANPKLEQDPAHDVTLTMPDGQRVTFYFKPQSAGGLFGFLLYPRYVPEAGVYGSLTGNGCGLLVVSGGQYYCFPGGNYQPTQFNYTDPYGRQFVMGPDGTLQSITDLNGNVLTFSPDGISSSAGGLSVPIVRDAQGRITQITGPDGNAYTYDYDSNGDLATVHLPGVAQPITYSYQDHYFSGAVDPRGNPLITDTYYPDGRLESETDALGNTWHYEYNVALSMNSGGGTMQLSLPNIQALNSGTIKVTNPDGGTVISTYDSYGMLLSRTDELGRTTMYTYDNNHNLLSKTDPLGHTTSFTYDDNGRPNSIRDAYNQLVASVAYNQFGGPTIITDGLGNTSNVTYDSNFMPVDITDNLGSLGGYTWDSNGDPLTRTNGDGQSTSFIYDQSGNLLSQTDPLGHTTHYAYDNFGRVLTVTDPLGYTTTYTYDALGHALTSTDALGKTTQYKYDANGNLVESIDPLNRHTFYQYDAANRLIQTTWPDGTNTNYTYDFRGKLLTQTDALGHVTRYTYDLAGELLSVTSAYGLAEASTVSYQYDAAGRKVQSIDARGNATSYSYENDNRLVQVTNALGGTTINTYDVLGQLLSTKDANGNITSYTYDARGHQVRTTYADNTSGQSSYDGAGRLISSTDQTGHVTNYQYDAAGRLTAVITAYGTSDIATTQFSYDDAGRKVSVADPLAHTTSYAYDAVGRLLSTTDPLGDNTTSSYDTAGQMISSTDANGHTTQYSYDSMGRRTRTTFPDGATLQQTHDALGRLIASTDQNGKTTSYSYDALGRLLSVTDPMSETTSYSYDVAGNLLSVTDANGHQTSFSYDALDHQVQKIFPDSSYEAYGYDANGNRTSLRLADGNINTFAYDAMNRLLTASYFDGQTISFSYTSNGLRASVVDGRGATRYTYDNQDRPIQVTQPNGQSISYTYDATGNRLSMTTPTGTIAYTYDAASRLTSVTDLQGGMTSYTYDPAGLRTGQTLPNGVTSAYSYDALNRMTGIVQSKGGTILASYGYILDAVGNRLSEQDTVKGLSSTVTYQYDDIYRLTHVSTPGYSADYTYDATGNRLSQSVNGTITNYTYNSFDELLTAGPVQYQYDGRGNLIQTTDGSNVTHYAYDAADRLTVVTLPDGTTLSNLYDADERRVQQTIGSQTTNFLWDEQSPYGDVVLETDSHGTTLASYTLGGTQLISQMRSGTTSYYLPDGQGSTRALTNSSGAITDTYAYTAFGETLNHTGSAINAYQYTGQQFDSATGLYDLRARYYDPTLGRFLSQDTFPIDFNHPLQLNRYVYTADNPVNQVDPSGNQAFTEYALNTAKTSAATGAVIGAGFGFVNALVCGGNVWANVGAGAVVGAGFGAGAVLYPGVTSIAAIGLGAYGLGSSAFNMYQNGFTACNVLNAVGSVAAIGAGGVGLRNYLSTEPIVGWITPGGAIITDELLAIQGTSPDVGNFLGIKGLTIEQIIARIPKSWIWEAMANESSSEGGGILFKSTDGLNEIRIHGPTTNPDIITKYPNDPGVLGWTVRIGEYKPSYIDPQNPNVTYVDKFGFVYRDNLGNIVPLVSADGHIPIFGNPFLNTP